MEAMRYKLSKPPRVALIGILLTIAACVVAQSHSPSGGELTSQTGEAKAPVKLAVKHLPNAYRVHEKVISGGQPDGERAFKELADLGVKTVVSVDGARPCGLS